MASAMPTIPATFSVLARRPRAHAYGCAFDFLTATAVGTHVTLLGKTPSPKIIMKALEEVASEEEDTSGEEVVSYKDEGDATTGLGALLAGLKL